MVDIDPQKLYGKGLSPVDVSNAINTQNVILPAGTQKIGDREYNVRLNSSPEVLQVLNDLPIKQVNGAVVYIRDVAQVRDGFAVQTNIVAQNRIRSALLTVLKSASASTIDIIKRVKQALPAERSTPCLLVDWRWLSAFWSMRQLLRSKTSIAISRCGNR